MTITFNTIPDSILYPAEDRAALVALANQLVTEFQPQDQAELDVLEQMLITAWLRKRYETVRARLYDSKHALTRNEPDSPRIPVILKSIDHFQLEVERHKKQFNSYRRILRQLRAGETPYDRQNEAKFYMEVDREFAPAA